MGKSQREVASFLQPQYVGPQWPRGKCNMPNRCIIKVRMVRKALMIFATA